MRFSSKPAIFSATGAWGFYYYGYRFYDPGMQRWLNRDPLGEEGGLNVYRALLNTPINSWDAFGERPKWVDSMLSNGRRVWESTRDVRDTAWRWTKQIGGNDRMASCMGMIQSWTKDCYENGRLDFPF
jgi:RHS repeat-associated protein